MVNDGENKKTWKAIIKALLILIIVIIAFIGGYLFNENKSDVKEKDNKITVKDDKSKEVEIDINSEEVMGLYLPFSYHTHEASDEELFIKDKTNSSELSTEYRNRLALAHYIAEGNKSEGMGKLKNAEIAVPYLSSKTLESYYKELFGTDIEYTPKSFNAYGIMSSTMIYYENENRYYSSIEGGDISIYRFANELYKAVKKNDTIELYVYVITYYPSNDGFKISVFKSLEDAKNSKNLIAESSYENYQLMIKNKTVNYKNNELYIDDISAYKEEASQYKLLFKLENNNYVFKSIERVK